MGWLKRLLGDDAGIEKLEDEYPTNTFIELYLMWIALVLTFLVIVVLASMCQTWLTGVP